jgi:hypothetical protein
MITILDNIIEILEILLILDKAKKIAITLRNHELRIHN